MNTAVILAGGIGSRMNMQSHPKQYLPICGRPIIDYALSAFEQHPMIDHIVIVLAEPWKAFMDEWLGKSHITKFIGYAPAGSSRQHSILNGLRQIKKLMPATQKVIIHDAARPLVSQELISACIQGLDEAEGVMPALPVTDTCYQSNDGRFITGRLRRNELFAGQAPEAFRFSRYLDIQDQLTEEELMTVSGSSELAFKNGMRVLLVPGSKTNIKVTTREDLQLVEQYLKGGD